MIFATLLLISQISSTLPQDVRAIEVDAPPSGNNITRQLMQAAELAELTGAPEVVIPPGKWTISQPIDWNPSRRFRHITIRGEGGGIPYTATDGTEIKALFDKGPIFVFQNVRGACLRNLRLIGPGSEVGEPNNAEAWRKYYASRNLQLAGLAIDPWTGSPPEGEHLETDNWTRGASSMVLVENCQFRFLGCGLVIHGSGGEAADRQGDYLKVRDCNFQWCRFGASINGSQTRGNVFDGCHFWDCYAGIAGGLHGVRRCGPIQVLGGSFDRVHYCVKTEATAYGNAIVIARNEGEQIGCIADCRAGHGTTRLTIRDNNFKMRAFGSVGIPHLVYTQALSTIIESNTIRLYQDIEPTAVFRLGGGIASVKNNLFRQTSNPLSPTFVVVPSMMPDDNWRPRIDNNYRYDWVTTAWPEGSGQRELLRNAERDGDAWVGTIRGDTQYHWQLGQIIASQHPNDDEVGLFRVVGVWPAERKAAVEPIIPLDDPKAIIEATNRFLYQVDRK